MPPDQIDEANAAQDTVQRFTERVTDAGLSGGVLIVSTRTPEKEGLQSFTAGAGLDESSLVPLAETSMLPTTMVLLSLVDDGTLVLDEPIGPTLPWLTGPASTITLRQLLSHTSGLPDSVDCAEPTPSACDAAMNSRTVLTGESACTASTAGGPPNNAMWVKELSG